MHFIAALLNCDRSQLTQTDPHDALHHDHNVVHRDVVRDKTVDGRRSMTVLTLEFGT